MPLGPAAGRRLSRGLALVGLLVWGPYLACKFVLGHPFPIGWILGVHIPCMVSALVLRLWVGRRATP